MSGPPKVGIDGRGRLVATNVFPWHEAIKDLPGSGWAPSSKYWYMPASPEIAARLLSILSESGASVSPRVLALVAEHSGRESRRAAAADESAPLPDLPWDHWLKTDPWRHQKRGIAFLREASTAAIGAGMGTGKSLMVVGGANAKGIRKLLIVAPAKAAGVWPREFRLHSAVDWHVLNGNRKAARGPGTVRLSLAARAEEMIHAFTRCGCGRPHAVVVGYEALAKDPLASADMLGLGIEMVVYDEAHRLKSPGGGSSLTAYAWVRQIPCRAVLSGTLMPQNPADIYATYRAVDPGIWGTNHTSFLAEWIVMGQTRDGRAYPKDVKGNRKVEFSRRFHSILYLPTVDLKLPPMIHSVRPVTLEPAARKVYDDVRDKGLAEITAAVVAAGGNPTPAGDERTVAPKNAGVELTRLAQITGGATRDDDDSIAVVSRAKAADLADLLDEVGCRKGGVDGRHAPEPVVVFCRFRHDLDAVREVATKAKLRYAEVSGTRKDGLDADAKMNPECDVVGVQVASGGEAVDFTRAHIVVWYSIGWELWRFQQAQKRVHRPGQTRPTLNYYLVCDNTIDGVIYAALARRENVIDSVVTAYLRDGGAGAEVDAEALPAMMDESGELVGAPVGVPDWLLSPDEPSRKRVDPQRVEVHRQLALSGFEGLLD